MKILLGTHVFSPSVGGIESCSLDLALAISHLGHEVQVITQTPSNNPKDDHGLKVVRRPGKIALIRLIGWCDVFFQNNISLQTAWPLIFIRRPWVVCTATWLKGAAGSKGAWGYLKWTALRFATNVYISKAMCEHIGYRGNMVPNPYRSETFRIIPGIRRERSLVFLGRLVSDKGCDLLIKSLGMLRDSGLALPLTIIGSGPEEAALKRLIASERLDSLVHFAGVLSGEALARELNRHQVLVVPSRWEEPFGIVALEGIACGCLVVGSARGGLPDAIGPCGALFNNGDAYALSGAIREVFEKRLVMEHLQEAICKHLNCHRVEAVAARYVVIFNELCLKSGKSNGHLLYK
jgi:glycogen synthase